MKSLDESYQHLAASHIHGQLEALAAQLDGVREASDIECVHQARVASRRLRSALQMFGGCFPPKKFKRWRNGIRSLTKDLGDARDLDVQIDFVKKSTESLSGEEAARNTPGLARLQLRLEQRRAALQPGVVSAVDALEESGILGEMHAAVATSAFEYGRRNVGFQSAYVFCQAERQIEDRLEALRAHGGCLGDPAAAKKHHAMRIAAKRLRYTLEICAPAFEGALDDAIKKSKKLQTLLGAIHDCDVWAEELALFEVRERERTLDYFGHMEPFELLYPGIAYLQEERHDTRVRLFEETAALWAALEEEGAWTALLELTAERAADGAGSTGETEMAGEQEDNPDEDCIDSGCTRESSGPGNSAE